MSLPLCHQIFLASNVATPIRFCLDADKVTRKVFGLRPFGAPTGLSSTAQSHPCSNPPGEAFGEKVWLGCRAHAGG